MCSLRHFVLFDTLKGCSIAYIFVILAPKSQYNLCHVCSPGQREAVVCAIVTAPLIGDGSLLSQNSEAIWGFPEK